MSYTPYHVQQARKHAHLEAMRNDPSKTAARYDEIVRLRMMLMDVEEMIVRIVDDLCPGAQQRQLERARSSILKAARRWGRKGDCV